MKISLDGGAFCTEDDLRFGTYTFSKSLIESIQKYENENEYYIYSFCSRPSWLETDKKLHYKILKPKTLWLSTRVSLEEIQQKKDIFLALNQAIPFSTRSKVISFSHGLSFYFYPQFYPDSYPALKDQLGPMINKSRYIVLPSRRVKNEMEKLFPNYDHFVTINYGVPSDMLDYKSRPRKKYFLFVGMNHPIKNIEFMLKVFKKFKENKKFSGYKLFLVGNLSKLEDNKSDIYSISNITRHELKIYYSEATALLTASFYESFNFPVLEAVSQNCPVIGLDSAVIPEFKKLVYLAYDSTDFLLQMTEISEGANSKIERREVLSRFSWRKYISKLKELYKIIENINYDKSMFCSRKISE